MKAVFHTGVHAAWGDALGDRPWCLAPVGGKPLIEYWLEWAAELGVDDVRIVLGDGADEVEAFVGEGSRWGLKVDYGFLRNMADPDAYLRRDPEAWAGGLLYICGPVFPRRLALPPWPKPDEGAAYRLANGPRTACLLSRRVTDLAALLGGQPGAATGDWAAMSLDPQVVPDTAAYYALNMRLVGDEGDRYVPPGYSTRDGATIGYNVLIPPSVDLRPPLTIGNDCRFHPMAVVGPHAVIGSHVIVDRQTALSECIVLDGTYLGRNLEITGKIVSGSRVISPDDGSFVEISEPWLLAPLESRARLADLVRALAGWVGAIVLAVLQAIPFCLLCPPLTMAGVGRYHLTPRLGPAGRRLRLPVWTTLRGPSRLERVFIGLSLDLFPLLLLAALGRLWLCGHAPLHPERDAALRKRLQHYFPAAIGYHTRHAAIGERAAETTDALYYERYRSPGEDLRTVLRALTGRLLDALSTESAAEG